LQGTYRDENRKMDALRAEAIDCQRKIDDANERAGRIVADANRQAERIKQAAIAEATRITDAAKDKAAKALAHLSA
jgi:F0F1-type ATP synthase membrane subunit b/b'